MVRSFAQIMHNCTYTAVKPGAFRHTDAIVMASEGAGLEVLARKEKMLSRELAAKFYAEHEGKPFFSDLIDHMTSGPIAALVLRRRDRELWNPNFSRPVWQEWRDLIGPTNVDRAKEVAPECIRARFGGEGTGNNAVHGSDSGESVLLELGLIFPELEVEKFFY